MGDTSRRTVHPALKIAVGLHTLAITLWSIPQSPKVYAPLVYGGATQSELDRVPKPLPGHWILIWNDRLIRKGSPVGTYLMTTGLWQYWDMFAPNPMSNDFWVEAKVDFTSGTKSGFIPRMSQLDFFTRYRKERYRKFGERIHQDENKWAWPYWAQGIARQAFRDTGEAPLRVHLIRHWRFLLGPTKPLPPYKETEFETYEVKPEDLKP
ncbi:MAG: hypothetical protein JST40_05975 [Armatimonadetes bacterium]|nr:hypothetical protein [Armatimonadota bacterium]